MKISLKKHGKRDHDYMLYAFSLRANRLPVEISAS